MQYRIIAVFRPHRLHCA